jgi:predicted molibdopterin-dependent oxidoreductase YjgC
MWISKLAERFEVEVSAHVSVLFDEVAAKCFGGISFSEVGERAQLPPRAAAQAEEVSDTTPVSDTPGLRLVAYRPLFSGAAVERTPELDFQKPDAEIQLSRQDANARGIKNGQTVTVSSNGTSVELRAQLVHDPQEGVVRVPRDHAGELHATVEIKP